MLEGETGSIRNIKQGPRRFWFHTFSDKTFQNPEIPQAVRDIMTLHNMDHQYLRSLGSASHTAEKLPGMDSQGISKSYLNQVKNVKASNEALPKEHQKDHSDL